MPAEKFYPSTAVEDRPSDRFEVAWHRDYPGVHVTMIMVGYSGATVVDRASAIDLDRSGINRLIRTLRKARDQTYGADE